MLGGVFCVKKTVLMFSLFALIIISGCTTTEIQEGAVSDTGESGQTFRILHIMSYHSPWKWTDDQLSGFKDGLGDLDAEYEIYQMDTKRRSSEEWKIQAGEEAMELIGSWKPDLIYTNDDNAQIYVMKYYVNSSIPHVFSAVNSDPGVYGYSGSTNVAGVMEQEHFVETVNLLKEIVPGVKKIGVVIDEGATWPAVVDRMKEKSAESFPDIEFVGWEEPIDTFEEFRQKMNDYQTTVDAVALLGIFTFGDENGTNVPYEDVLQWVAENSQLPDFSYWEDRISYGTLCAVTVSGYEQGLAAGRVARGILAEGKSPSGYPFEATVRGRPVISLARANKLGISISSDVLLTAGVVEQFEWEK
ncbi:MAG: hypothetical protein JW754_04860 [Candidatus Aenigmarchaeota archaeon]|nr:hypothetical protein [Candidatus Aenigmarchaeota archaeon]